MQKILGMLEEALRQGVDISFDQYPYTATSTSLSVLLPGWALEGGWEGLRKRLDRSDTRGKILAEMKKAIENRGGPASIRVASVQTPENQRSLGKTLEEVSEEKDKATEQAVLEMLIEEKLQILAIYHSLSENDVELAMGHPLQMVGSDGILGEFPHPRAYGTFPRLIHHFSRERRLFPLEEAIRKMTDAPARRLNLRNRGQIAEGCYGDILLFEKETLRDMATFENPKQVAAGLDWAFVNGVPVIAEGKLQERFPGQVIKRG